MRVKFKTLAGHEYAYIAKTVRVKGRKNPTEKSLAYLGRVDQLASNEGVRKLTLQLAALTKLIPIDSLQAQEVIQEVVGWGLKKAVRAWLERLGVLPVLRQLETIPQQNDNQTGHNNNNKATTEKKAMTTRTRRERPRNSACLVLRRIVWKTLW